MPSIATTYRRDRKEHDATARKWTQLYALPPKPPKNAKDKAKASDAKGKGKAASSTSTIQDLNPPGTSTRSSGRLRSRRAARPAQEGAQSTNEVISLLSDSEDTSSGSVGEATGLIDLTKTRAKRRHNVDEDEPQSKNKMRRVDDSRVAGTLDDVIVIED